MVTKAYCSMAYVSTTLVTPALPGPGSLTSTLDVVDDVLSPLAADPFLAPSLF